MEYRGAIGGFLMNCLLFGSLGRGAGAEETGGAGGGGVLEQRIMCGGNRWFGEGVFDKKRGGEESFRIRRNF